MLSTFHMQTSNKIPLFGCNWTIQQPKAVVCLIHGLGEHIQRYDNLAQSFNREKMAFIGIDRMGFGESGGVRGHVSSFEDSLDEVEALIQKASETYPNVPIVLYGHSQGGNIVLNYVIRRENKKIKALISTSPWIKLSNPPSKILVTLAKISSKLCPKFSNNSKIKFKDLSRDTIVNDSYRDDKLVHQKITSRNAIAMLEASEFLVNYKGRINIPTLITHGDKDNITSMTASLDFSKQIQGDITFKIWEGLYHETHNEPEKEQVIDFMFKWIEKKI